MAATTTTHTITDTLIQEVEDFIDANPEQFARQVELEEQMRGMGIARFRTNVEEAHKRGKATETGSVRRLMAESTVAMIAGINDFIAECETGKAGKKHTAYQYFKVLEPEAIALLTSRVVLDAIAKETTLTSAARSVAQMIEDEIAFRAFKAAEPKVFDFMVKREKSANSTSYRRQRISMMHNAKARGVSWEEWSPKTQTLVGSKLIELMIERTGLVTTVKHKEGHVETTMLVATPETIRWINEENGKCEAMSPMYLPTVMPPRPWTSPTEGGYWTPRVRRLTLLKARSKPYLEELAEHDMPAFYDAINAMQATSWTINNQVLDVVRTLWESKSTMGDIPQADDLPDPVRPLFMEQDLPKEEWTDEQKKEFGSWKHKATDVHDMNAKMRSLRIQFAKILMVAEMFEEEEELFFPHQADFRGRAYCVPMFLNPQGCDVSKALLTFSNAVPLGDQEGADWLAIHGANTYGFDKASLKDRVKWVEKHEDVILGCAADPYSNKFWCDADKPFQFLAFCFEWAGYKAEGFDFLSSIPVAMDGSCNGLQNFSAMLLDEIGGKAVNLMPSETPADIYQAVADRVLARVMIDAAGDDEELAAIARGWLIHGVNRKVCKRPVMTLAYGAKAFGFRAQVFDDTIHPYKYSAGEAFPWEGSGRAAAAYMGDLIWDCVGEVVVAARQAMEWLQKAARAASKEGLPVRWETPDGLPVLQAYSKPLINRIELTFKGERLRLNVAVGPTSELDKHKQANSISPNWIHSMDASHMRATVRRGYTEGLRSFSLIHDSYGTHAGNSWALARFLREEFVAMYSDDLLNKFRDELSMQLPDGVELDAIPMKGTLDLSLVLDSPFFFA